MVLRGEFLIPANLTLSAYVLHWDGHIDKLSVSERNGLCLACVSRLCSS